MLRSWGCSRLGLGVITLILYLRYALGFAWMSGSAIYLILFWLFHFGLTFVAVFRPELLTAVDERNVLWVASPTVRMAMLLALLGATGFVFGAGLWGPCPRPPNSGERWHDPGLYNVGWLVMIGGLGLSFGALSSEGLGVYAYGYREFRQIVLSSNGLFAYIELSHLGCVLALCGAERNRWRVPLAVWAIFAVGLLLLGLRNEAMIPLLAFIVVLAHRGVRFNRGLMLAAVFMAMVAMPAIGSFRTVGFANRALVNWTDVAGLDTAAELGGTLRAVKAYVDWIEGGDSLLLGASYWAPLDRHFLSWVVPERERIPIDLDERVPARLMAEREGSVGQAATGEAYYNFGVLGPFIFFAGVGAMFGWLERRAWVTPYRTAMLGVVLFPFYWNIRGQWVGVPAQLAVGVALVALCYLLSRLRPGAASATIP
jgi:hypothetical protein